MTNRNAIAKSLASARDKNRETIRAGRKISYTPFKDESKFPIVFAFPDNPRAGSPMHRAKLAFEAAIEKTKAVPAAKKEIFSNPNLSDAGRKLELTRWVAQNAAPGWREHWNAIQREKKNLEERISKIKLKPADQSPEKVREREEIRTRLFQMNDAQRNEFVKKYRHSDPNIVAAVVERIPELSGVFHEIHEHMTAELLGQQYAAELSDIADTSEALDAAERAIIGGRDEARKQSGISFAEYDKILGEVERQVDEKFSKQPNAEPQIPGDDEVIAIRDGVSKLTSKQRSELIDFAIGLWKPE
jgi:hypothetical protein